MVSRFVLRLCLFGLLLMATAPAFADEGMWVFNNLPLEHAQGEVRLRAAAGLGRAPAVVGRPVQQRRLGLVRLGRRPGHDQPPRRGRHARRRSAPSEKDYYQRRLPRQDPRRGGQGPRPGAERPGRHRGRDRPGQRRRSSRAWTTPRPTTARRKAMAEIEKESTDKTGPAERRRHALPGRAVSPLHLQEVHRRPARLRPRVRHRLLRRRPGQLRVSPLRPRRLLLPRLRGRQAGQARALPEVEPGRREGRRPGLRRRAPRPDRPAEHASASLEYLRDVALPARCSTCSTTARRSCSTTADAAPRQRRQAKEDLFGIQNSRKARDRRPGGPAATRRSWPARREAENGAARRGSTPTREAGRPTARPGTGSPRPRRSPPRSSSRYNFLERGSRFDSQLFRIARTLVRLAEEKAKPNAERLREYRDSALDSLELAALLRGADLPRLREGQARRLARPPGRSRCADDPMVEQRPRRPDRPSRRPTSWSTAPSSPTSPSARSWPRAARRRSRLRRPDDQAGPGRRRRRPRRPQAARGRGRGRRRPSQYAQIAKAQFEEQGRLDLPRRDVHAAAGLRHGQGLRGRRQDDPALHHDRRRLRARRGARQQAAVRAARRAGIEAKKAGPAEARHAVQLRLARPTSSAATRAARSSTATTRSSA